MKLKPILYLSAAVFIVSLISLVSRFNSITKNSIVTTRTDPSVTYTTLAERIKHKQAFTILLLGYAGGKHDGTYLTDSIIAVHIDPKNKKTYLLSIPRDTWINIRLNDAEEKHMKINAAYQIGMDDKGYPNKKASYKGAGGGGKLVEDAVTLIYGQPVDRFLAIDFAGFKNTIDTLGGVDITVDTTFDDFAYPLDEIPDESCGHTPDEIKEYTATVSAEQLLWEYFPCRYKHLHFDAGQTHMNGGTALEYVRSRHSAVDGSDFGRAKRQRNLLIAVKDKILSASFIPRVLPFMESLGKDIKTDISLPDLKALIENIKEFNTYELHTYALTDKNYLNLTNSADGQSILAPKEGIDSWSRIHEWISDIVSGRPVKTPAVVRIENGTKTAGLATKATDTLNELSIQTVVPTNSPEKTEKTTVTIFDKNIKSDDILVLLKEFGVSEVLYGTHTTDAYNVLIKIGADYRTLEQSRTTLGVDKRN